MTNSAYELLQVLNRWSTGSIHKFAEELDTDPVDLLAAAHELQVAGFVISYPMKDGSPFGNAMLEITQKGLDFIETYVGQINSETK
ncbi:hypothetical protein GCM10007415_43070 [Parapedobacter pyrenivorans]|uniref:Uncharacterized protein n=1 Tax=Parapedobacter pyrenivorans TaxID=1305674 RepID=A0A917I266_9SPHI|nr:hypothetical protein [Parapedobacter pyrenivorans]GGH02268.1 hypothetical protein GCM10007415_43070 [Parapedobacter pyrenivorans]